jgi:hypothetical protein
MIRVERDPAFWTGVAGHPALAGALMAGMEAIGLVWLSGFSLVTTFEVETNPHSRPPKTFGFTRSGDWRETPFGNLRLWTLSRAAWAASPAAQRRNVNCQ